MAVMSGNPQTATSEPSAFLENKADILAYFEKGYKPYDQWRIGTEHEKFLYRRSDKILLPYEAPEGEASIRRVLNTLADRYSWTAIMEGENIIGVTKGKYSINLESGGQLELSGAPVADIHLTARELNLYLAELRAICSEQDVGILGIGYHPTLPLPSRPQVPRTRYEAFYSLGGETMDMRWGYLTCAAQANYDIGSESDMVKKLRVSLALQPIIMALFASSPFKEGRETGYCSYRYAQSLKTHQGPQKDFIEMALSPDMSWAHYIEFLFKRPLHILYKNGVYQPIKNAGFGDFMNGNLSELPGERPTMDDFLIHISSIYTDVRLRNYLEMRGSDAGKWRMLIAQPAVWAGLLYDADALEAAWQLVRKWTPENLMRLRAQCAKDGLKGRFRLWKSVQNAALDVLEIARMGLRNRAVYNEYGEDETVYLDHIFTFAATGKTPAEFMVDDFKQAWGRDLNMLIERNAL